MDPIRKVYESWRFESKLKKNQKFGIKVKVTLEQAMKAQRGSRGIALLFL
jgi:hypothetical protein